MLSHKKQDYQRAFVRSKTFLAATMQVKEVACPVRVRNLSPLGAMIEAASVPGIGTTITVGRGSLAAAAEVVWTEADHFGVRFTEEVDVARWISERHQTDSMAPVPSTRISSKDGSAQLDLDDSIIASRIADEISYLGRVMEGVSDILSKDPLLRHRHARSIQDLAIGEEMLDQLAAVLKTTNKIEAIKQTVTGSMRGRLLRN